MKKHFLISINLLLASFSYSQSVIGFSGGYYNPLSYISYPKNGSHFSAKNAKDHPSYFLAIHLKERKEVPLNLGFNHSLNRLLVDYSYYNGGLGGGSSTNAQYETYVFHTQVNLEFYSHKQILFFSFGPDLAFPISSFKKSESAGWSAGSPSRSSSYSEGKNKDAHLTVGVFSELSIEAKISEKYKFFVRTQIKYSFNRIYDGLKTLDYILGAGFLLDLPNVSLTKKGKKKPWELS